MCDCKYKKNNNNKCKITSDFRELINPSNCYTNCGCEDEGNCTDCSDVIVVKKPKFTCNVPIAVRKAICDGQEQTLKFLNVVNIPILNALKTGDFAPLYNLIPPSEIVYIFLADGTILFQSVMSNARVSVVPGPPIPAIVATVLTSGLLYFIGSNNDDGSATYAYSEQTTVQQSVGSTTVEVTETVYVSTTNVP
jgi:hypothetical protein